MNASAITFTPNVLPISRDGSRLTGRLIAFPTSKDAHRINPNDIRLARAFAIDFPAMPDSIEFARRAEYIVQTSFVMPDGIHAYKKTHPLRIPISFRLHYNDPYCPQGALTLLHIAARLHAFVLPLSLNDKGVETAVKQNIDYRQNSDEDVKDKAQTPFAFKVLDQLQFNKIFSPLTARLELMFAAHSEAGVSCNGYVEEVNVKLNGPFMRGPDLSYNLPTSADYSFVFIHRPGHGNARDFIHGLSAQTDAYATDVRDRFYNTSDMTILANYQGFEPAPTTQQQATQQGVNSTRVLTPIGADVETGILRYRTQTGEITTTILSTDEFAPPLPPQPQHKP